MNVDPKKPALVSFCLLFVLLCTLPHGQLLAQSANLTPREHDGTLLRIKTVVEVAGSLLVDSGKEKKTTIPLKVDAEMFFDQRGLTGDDLPSIRHYWEAHAKITINEKEELRALREARQVVLLQGDSNRTRFTSPLGPLMREEIELVDVVGSAFPAEQLLPAKRVSQADTWGHDDEVVLQLLRLEQVADGELTSEVTEITDDVVKVKLAGSISGKADGATTEMEVVGNYHYDRASRVVKWLAIAVKEKRDAHFAAPGFEVVARIRAARQVVESSTALSDKSIAAYPLTPTVGDQLLDYISHDQLFQMALDRRWFQLSQRPTSAVFRMVDEGDLLATCKLDRLVPAPAGKELSLTGFQSDVRNALDKNCKEIISATESVNPQGLRVLRVVATGEVAKAPIRWIYYHVSDKVGERVSVIFTHEASVEERFTGLDQSLISSVRFLEPQQPEEQQASTGKVVR